MNFKEFENLIGKDISTANYILATDFDNKALGGNLYFSNSDVSNYFYGMPYKVISIKTNDMGVIEAITIVFLGVIDRSFYDTFILDYGEPNTIQVIDGRDDIGKWTKPDVKEEGDIEQSVRKVTLIMKEGKFEDNPLFMIWNKKRYQIRTLLKYEQNMSEITFRIPTNKF